MSFVRKGTENSGSRGLAWAEEKEKQT